MLVFAALTNSVSMFLFIKQRGVPGFPSPVGAAENWAGAATPRTCQQAPLRCLRASVPLPSSEGLHVLGLQRQARGAGTQPHRTWQQEEHTQC